MSLVPLCRDINWKLEMLKRVPEKARKEIEARIWQLRDVEHVIHVMEIQMVQDDWATVEIRGRRYPSVLVHEEMPYHALIAFSVGKITSAQFATLAYFWSALQHYGAGEIITCSLRERRWENILDKLLTIPGNVSFEERFGPFIQLLNLYPLSEQRFFLFRLPKIPTPDSIMAVANNFGMMPFTFMQIEKVMYRVIPSFTMMGVNLLLRHGKENFVILNPVLGLSSQHDMIQCGLNHTRDVAFHFPHTPLPQTADTREAPWDHYTFHDEYHADRCSSITRMHRPAFIHLAEQCNEEWNQRKAQSPISFSSKVWHLIRQYEENDDGTKTRHLRMKLIDMDFWAYRFIEGTQRTLKLTSVTAFWLSLAESIHQNHFSPKGEEKIWGIFCRAIAKMDATLKLSELPNSGGEGLLMMHAHASVNMKYLPKYAPGITDPKRIQLICTIWRKIHDPHFLVQESHGKTEEYIRTSAVPFFTPENIVAIFNLSADADIHAESVHDAKANGPLGKHLTRLAMNYMAKHFHKVVDSSLFSAFQKTARFQLFLQLFRKNSYSQTPKNKAALAALKP